MAKISFRQWVPAAVLLAGLGVAASASAHTTAHIGTPAPVVVHPAPVHVAPVHVAPVYRIAAPQPVWVPGHYEWRGSHRAWVPGHHRHVQGHAFRGHDRDRDGVPNRWDRAPHNPRRH